MSRKSAEVPVNRKVLQWALDRAKNRTSLDRYFPQWKEWLKGDKKPTLRQLEKLARLARIPFGYLFLSSPPEMNLPIPYFRTIREPRRGGISDTLMETVRIASHRQDWLREYLQFLGEEPLDFVGSAREIDDVKTIARQIKEKLSLDDNWGENFNTWRDALRFLRNRIEEIGIFTFFSGVVGNNTQWPIRVEDFRGFVLVDDYAPVVFVNSSDAISAQIFTLLHELAHIWIGKSAAFDLRSLKPANDEIEMLCHKVAAEILAPIRISGYTAHSNRITGKDSKWDFYESLLERLGRRFSIAVHDAVKSGDITYREAYRLTGIHGRTFDNFMRRLERKETRP